VAQRCPGHDPTRSRRTATKGQGVRGDSRPRSTLAIGVSGAAIYDALKYLIVRARKSLGDDMQAHLDIQHLAKRPGADGVVSVQTVSLEGDAETVLRGLRDILRVADEGGGPG